MSKFHKVGLV